MALGKFSPDADTNHATVDVRHRALAPHRTARHAVHALGSCLAFTLTSRDAILNQVKAVAATTTLVGWWVGDISIFCSMSMECRRLMATQVQKPARRLLEMTSTCQLLSAGAQSKSTLAMGGWHDQNLVFSMGFLVYLLGSESLATLHVRASDSCDLASVSMTSGQKIR